MKSPLPSSLLQEYQKLFPDIPIGYSGHETGIAISVAAVALGAKVLERHITLDKTWKGSDHLASLEPGELAELVRSVRLVERALGSPTKQLLPCEMACNEKVGAPGGPALPSRGQGCALARSRLGDLCEPDRGAGEGVSFSVMRLRELQGMRSIRGIQACRPPLVTLAFPRRL